MTLKDKHFAGEDVINGKQLLRSEKRLDITQTAEHPLHVRPGRRYEATGEGGGEGWFGPSGGRQMLLYFTL